jgi:hypothetical protein
VTCGVAGTDRTGNEEIEVESLKYLLALLVGVVLGVVGIGAARYATLEEEHPVHYHANWAIFVDGNRLDLTAPRYMEDVYQCMLDPSQQNPEDRVHMHEGNHDVVHVHASGVTWGHLLANLGFGIGDDYLYTDTQRLENTSEKTLKFVLNGRPVATIANAQIGNQDRLLISYGPESVEEVIGTQFPQVASDANRYNEMPDPASCSGHVEMSTGERLRRAFWF